MACSRLHLFFRLWRWQLERRSVEGQGKRERYLLWAVAGLLGVGMLGTGLAVEWMLWMIPPPERLHAAHAMTLSLVLFWPLLHSLWQEGPDVPLRSWLLWPVSRTWLIHALQGFSVLHIANGLLGLFLLGFWLGSIAWRFPVLPALGWLLAAALLVTGAQWTANLLRLLRYTWPATYVLVWLGGLAGLGLLSRQDGLAWLAQYTLEAPLNGKPVSLVLLLGTNMMLYGGGWVLMRRMLYADRAFLGRVPTGAAEKPRWSGSTTWLLVLLQFRLLWRHRFTRFAAFYLPMLFGVLGGAQLLVGLKMKSLLPILIGVTFLFSGTFQLVKDLFSLLSVFADGLFTWPISCRTLGRAALLVSVGLSLPTVTGTLGVWALLAQAPAFRIEAMQVQHLVSLFLYLIGLVHPLLLLQAPKYAVRLELHARSLPHLNAAQSHHSLQRLGMVFLLIVLATITLQTGQFGALLLGILGGAGLLLYPHWSDLLARQFIRHKHNLLGRLRAT